MNLLVNLKRVVCALLLSMGLLMSVDASAWWHHGGYHHGYRGYHHYHGYGWRHYGGWGNVGYYGARCGWIHGHWNRYHVWIPAHRVC